MYRRVRHVVPALIGLVLFVVALVVLLMELHAVSWSALTADIASTPVHRVVLAVLLATAGYAVLATYDVLAFAYLGRKLPRATIARTSFLAYAIGNSIGGFALSGLAIRYRSYTRAGLSGEEFPRLVFSYSVTFWVGILALGGLSLAFSPLPHRLTLPAAALVKPAGWLMMLVPVAYVATTAIRRRPLHVRQFELPLPTPRLALAQLAVSCLDWTIAAAVLFVLLPASQLSFVEFLGAFVAAILIGMASQAPGGVGVFEGLLLVMLRPFLTAGQLLPPLVIFRVVYYLGPFTVGVAVLVADELRLRRARVAVLGSAAGRLAEQLTPRVLSAVTFAAGLILLFSGATPAVPARLELLQRMLPLGIVEASHFLGSIAGLVLLLLSHGLARRLDAAYYLALAAIVGGILASILKGLDYEEALLLTVVLILLWRARDMFDRRAVFFETRFSPEWMAAVTAAIAASAWLGLFAFKHVAYSNELWWQFAFDAEASRYLRASMGMALVLLFFGIAWLLSAASHRVHTPDEHELAAAATVIAAQPSTFPYLAFLRDKALLFNDDRTGFVMYGVHGRTWVALGDPVGPPEAVAGLIRTFLERCDDFGGIPVFYEITAQYLHQYADLGLTFVKLGEGARVDLRAFSVEGGHAAKFRQAIRRLEKEQAAFRVIDATEVPDVMSDLRRVSDDWLKIKAGSEKKFSLGFFDETYLSRFPIAVVERAGRIVAFASLLPGSNKEEMSTDLMRYRQDAPKDVVEALLVHLCLWGQAQGYHWFSLGMAPLSGVEHSPVASLWGRVGEFLYEHGEAIYHFRGLRAFKQKFNPVWEPHYLAYPGGLSLPRALADVSALIAGGYLRIVMK